MPTIFVTAVLVKEMSMEEIEARRQKCLADIQRLEVGDVVGMTCEGLLQGSDLVEKLLQSRQAELIQVELEIAEWRRAAGIVLEKSTDRKIF